MEGQGCPRFDRIGALPSHISQTILMLLPLRDMARTSILSKYWRYQWLKVPQLVFENDLKYSAKKVFEILLLHHGPISKCSLNMSRWLDCSEIDKIILFLARNGIKELTLLMPYEGEYYKLLSSIFSCVELRHLRLSSCAFQPLTLVGFSKLVTLELLMVKLDTNVSISSCPLLESLVLDVRNVDLLSIDAPNLKILHLGGIISQIGSINTPHLKNICLVCQRQHFTGSSFFDLISFLHSVPLLEELHLSNAFLQALAIGDSRNKLSKSLKNLLTLELIGYTHNMEELSSVLWFIRSSPNLHKLKFTIWAPSFSQNESELYLKMQTHSNYSLLKLQEVEMVLWNFACNLGVIMELSKFLLDVSPVLKTLHIKPDMRLMRDVNGVKRLVELASYPRASPKVKIVVDGLESLN